MHKSTLKLLSTADPRGVIEWTGPDDTKFLLWKKKMEQLVNAGYVAERIGGGYNLTSIGLDARTPPPSPPPPVEPTTASAPPKKPRKSRAPGIPGLTRSRMDRLVADLPQRMAAMEADEEDRRCLRGKYAPPFGTCRVCGGRVVAEIRFPHTNIMGGPPLNAYVGGYSCEGCRIVYRECPPRAP